jgi:hypothetical protein
MRAVALPTGKPDAPAHVARRAAPAPRPSVAPALTPPSHLSQTLAAGIDPDPAPAPRHAASPPPDRPVSPSLGAPKGSPRLSAPDWTPWNPVSQLPGERTGTSNLLEVIASYFIPPGGGTSHLLLLVELALISSAIGFALFCAPLLRLVRVDGRRRAGYQAVALRPG